MRVRYKEPKMNYYICLTDGYIFKTVNNSWAQYYDHELRAWVYVGLDRKKLKRDFACISKEEASLHLIYM